MVAVAERPGDPSFAGRGTSHLIEHDLAPGDVATLASRVALRGTDGSYVTAYYRAHLTVNTKGEIVADVWDFGECLTTPA